MDKKIEKFITKSLQNPKTKLLCLLTIISTQFALPLFFPILKQAGFLNKSILRLSAHLLLLSLCLAIFYIIQWIFGKTSDAKCPFCGSYTWFVDSSASKKRKDCPTGYIRRVYKCSKCNNEERIFVAPLRLNIDPDNSD